CASFSPRKLETNGYQNTRAPAPTRHSRRPKPSRERIVWPYYACPEPSAAGAGETTMALKITLELNEQDLDYFRRVMDDVWRRNAKRAEKELLAGARRLLNQATKAKAPEYVQSRLEDLRLLLTMLDDPEWPLEDDDRKRIVAAVGYFAVPKDIIPDKIPGLGFLDDAIMAELVIRDLKPELDGYRDFCEYRDNEKELRGKTKT